MGVIRTPKRLVGLRITAPYKIPYLVVDTSTDAATTFEDEVEEFWSQPPVAPTIAKDPIQYMHGELLAKRLPGVADMAIDLLSAPGTSNFYQATCLPNVFTTATAVFGPFPFREARATTPDFEKASVCYGVIYRSWLPHGCVSKDAQIAEIASANHELDGEPARGLDDLVWQEGEAGPKLDRASSSGASDGSFIDQALDCSSPEVE